MTKKASSVLIDTRESFQIRTPTLLLRKSISINKASRSKKKFNKGTLKLKERRNMYYFRNFCTTAPDFEPRLKKRVRQLLGGLICPSIFTSFQTSSSSSSSSASASASSFFGVGESAKVCLQIQKVRFDIYCRYRFLIFGRPVIFYELT